MKKIIFACIGLLMALAAQGQTSAQKLPKLRLVSGFFTEKWELGDQEKSEKEVMAHLDKTHPASGDMLHRANRLGKAAFWATVAGGAGLIAATVLQQQDKLEPALACSGVAVAGFGTAAGLLIGKAGKRSKAIASYNRFAGY